MSIIFARVNIHACIFFFGHANWTIELHIVNKEDMRIFFKWYKVMTSQCFFFNFQCFFIKRKFNDLGFVSIEDYLRCNGAC